MNNSCSMKLRLLWSSSKLVLVFIALVLVNPPRRGDNLISAQIYTSRNECVSYDTVYEIKYRADHFDIQQRINFYTISPVTNCYFYAENFLLRKVFLWQNESSLRISIDEIGNNVIAVKLLYGDWLLPNFNYSIDFTVQKKIEATGEGLVFKVYRNLQTMKMDWYSMVKIGPAACGKVYVCINSLRSTQSLRIIVVHPQTHRLLCSGILSSPEPGEPGWLRSECLNSHKVGVNNMHFSIADFSSLVYDGMKTNASPHQIVLAAPLDELGQTYHEISVQFEMIQRIYAMLLLTMNLKPFHVFFYSLPNSDIERPQIRSGVCFFNFENMIFQLNQEPLFRDYIRCLIHQGFLNDRTVDSWPLIYASEGLFERVVSSFVIYDRNDLYYRDTIEGTADDLAPLGMHKDDVSLIPIVRPYRKSAGFFTMLASFSPSYAAATYSVFLENNRTIETLATFWPWISEHCSRLRVNETVFSELLYTWTALEGYPVIVAQVLNNRTVCVTQYGVGDYFRSYILPVQVEYNLPTSVRTEPFWTDPRGQDNCQTVETHLFPYLINSYMNVVGRVMYDRLNWEIWANDLMRADVRKGLTPIQKVQLVTDALYFASQRMLSYSVALRFLFVMRTEVDEVAWQNFDRSLVFLDAKVRYTPVYTLFKKEMSDLSEKFYNATEQTARPSEVAHKWSCMMGNLVCLNRTERVVQDTLRDHRFRHLPQVLCGGTRRIKRRQFQRMILSMGKPDWREPVFYVNMLLCAEDRKILRELLHHLFFHNSWFFQRTQLKVMLLKMIRASKAGSDAAFNYLNHDPEGMIERIGLENVLEIVQELVVYSKENMWFLRFVGRMKLRGIITDELVVQHPIILKQLRENKRWHNTQYGEVARFIMAFGKHLRKFEEDKEDENPEG